MTHLIATGFYTSLVSYFVFFFAEYARPGFVSFHFSVHWFLLASVLFGIWYALLLSKEEERNSIGLLGLLLLSLAIAFLFWREGETFGDFRGFLAVVGGLIPWVVRSLLGKSDQ